MVSPFIKSTTHPGDFVAFPPLAVDVPILQRFNEMVTQTPQKTAVSDHAASLSYAKLHEWVGKTATAVQRTIGIASDPKGIGLIFEPTVESIVGIMGVVMGGNVICPISPHDPPARIRYYLEDAEIVLILTTRKAFPDNLQTEIRPIPILFIEDVIAEIPESYQPTKIDPHRLAAILYTSGSTGKPKGVTHTHQTLMQMVRSKGNELGISPSDRIAGLARFTFGSYYLNVFGALLFGSSLHLFDFYRLHFEGLKKWLRDQKITLFHCTPTTLRQFLDVLDEPTVFSDLRLVSLGGETLYPKDVYQFQDRLLCSTALCTTGAAIETWFYSSLFFQLPLPDGIDQIPMGYINADCKVEVWDDKGLNLSHGQTGEICVNTASLSPGYWKRPELNTKKYVLGKNNERYFRSGDLGTFSPEGLLYHKGRMDFQIKVRGVRIDLGEIESTLHSHPEVKEAVVIGHIRQDNDTELVGYICTNPKRKVSQGEIYKFLASKLSPHQIPTRIIFLDSFPLTRTHKVDRHALPDPDEIEIARDSKRIAPRNKIEARIHEFWFETLGHKEFGVTDPFLEIGGESIAAIRIRARIEAEYQSSIPLLEFFIEGTIEKLSTLIHQPK